MQIKRILLPTDFSDNSLEVLPLSLEVAKKFQSKIYFLFVLDTRLSYPTSFFEEFPALTPEYFPAKSLKEAQGKLAELIEAKGGGAVETEAVVREGNPFMEIIRFAAETEIDLITIATHGYTGLKHVFLGSIAEKVVRKAPCPVLSFRPEAMEFEKP